MSNTNWSQIHSNELTQNKAKKWTNIKDPDVWLNEMRQNYYNLTETQLDHICAQREKANKMNQNFKIEPKIISNKIDGKHVEFSITSEYMYIPSSTESIKNFVIDNISLTLEELENKYKAQKKLDANKLSEQAQQFILDYILKDEIFRVRSAYYNIMHVQF